MASTSSNAISEYGSNESLHDLLPAFPILNLKILALFRSCFLFIIANCCPEGQKIKYEKLRENRKELLCLVSCRPQRIYVMLYLY
jgi:hypothetical protein